MSQQKKYRNVTPVSHSLLEAMAASPFFRETVRILAVIIRKVLGWHKMEDWIALSQFIKLTGMHKPNVCRALKKLEEGKIISKRKNGRRNIYRINLNYEQWPGVSAWKRLVSGSDNPDDPNGELALSELIPTKDTSTEDICIKNSAPKANQEKISQKQQWEKNLKQKILYLRENPSTAREEFFAFAEKIVDPGYAEKTFAQLMQLGGEIRNEIFRKMAVMLILKRSNPAKARVIFHELVGLVNDKGAMRQALSATESQKRDGFAQAKDILKSASYFSNYTS